MSRVIYEELQDKEGNIHYLHTEDKVVFDENGQSLRAAMKEVQFEDYTGTAELPSVETAVAGITRGRKWTDLFGNIKAALKGLKAKDEAIEGSMGDAFSEEKSYAVGDYAIYKDVLYKFTAAKTAGSWDAAKVQAVTVVGEVCSLNENITALETKITSFEQTKSEIVASGLGTALGLIASNTWAQIVAKLKNVVNRGAWNGSISASGGNVTVPAGYHNGSGKVTGPTLAALVGTGVNLASAASLLSSVTAYGKNGTKYTGTHVCRTLAQLVGSNVNLDNNAGLLSGYTAYGKNGVKYTGNIANLSSTIDNASINAGDQSHSCYRINGGVIEVVPRRGYWGNWNWEESCIRIPKTAGITLANGTFTMWDNGTVNIGFRPDIVVYWDEIGTLGLLSYYPSATTFFVNTNNYRVHGGYITDNGFVLPDEITYSEGRTANYIAIKYS